MKRIYYLLVFFLVLFVIILLCSKTTRTTLIKLVYENKSVTWARELPFGFRPHFTQNFTDCLCYLAWTDIFHFFRLSSNQHHKGIKELGSCLRFLISKGSYAYPLLAGQCNRHMLSLVIYINNRFRLHHHHHHHWPIASFNKL